MLQQQRGDTLGEGLRQHDVTEGDQHRNAVGDHVIREHVAHVLGFARRTQHLDVDVEADPLRLLVLARIGPDADRQHEIVDENVIGGRVLGRIEGIAARGQ